MDWLQTDHYFSGQQTGCSVCEQWFEKIVKCQFESEDNEAVLKACCRDQGVPYECSGYCTEKEVEDMFAWRCGKWRQQINECGVSNDGHVCCEEQGVPEKCCIMRNQQK